MKRCPPATRDPVLNEQNRARAVSLAQYGAPGPVGQACLNCRHYDAGIVASCLPRVRNAGYCEAYDFVAPAGAWCRAWAPRRG